MTVLWNKVRAGRHAVTGMITLALVACGGGGGSSDTGGSVDPAAEVISEFSGSVGDGPIVGATINFYDKDGRLIHTKTSDSNASYATRIRAKWRSYPITVEATGGTDLVTGRAPDFTLTSVLLNPRERRVNINPHSTIIVAAASSMDGGLNESNVAAARDHVVSAMNYGLDTQAVPDPINFDVTDDNVANVIKSSEALGEMIRRTRNELQSVDASIDGDEIVASLSADISDGVLDGRVNGAVHNAISRKAALVSQLVSTQVLIESMSNKLKVDGTVATASLDQAVTTTRPGIDAGSLTGSVPVKAEMLQQLVAAVEKARAVDPGNYIDEILSDIQRIAAGSMPSNVERILPPAAADEFVNSVNIAASSTDQQLDQIEGSDSSAPVTDQPGSTLPSPSLVISGTPASTVNEDSAYAFTPSVSGGSGGQVSFGISNRPAWAGFDSATGRLSGTPTNANVGTYSNITITATENGTSAALPAFAITVNNVNDAPTIAGNGAATMSPGQAYSFQPAASDADGDSLTFSVSNKPSWASFNTGTGRLSGTPGSSNTGTYSNIVIKVSDGKASASLPGFTITVASQAPSNTAPSISGSPSGSAAEGSSYAFQPSARDAEGDSLTFSIANRPKWASFNAGTGRLSGVPGTSDSGTYSNIVISVSDGSLSSSLAPFSINVADVNSAPTISGSPAKSVDVDGVYSFQPVAADADADSLTFSVSNRPIWALFDNATGRLYGTPRKGEEGDYSNIVIRVSDGKASASLPAFNLRVNGVSNGAPTISGSPNTSVQEASAYSFQPSASDPDGDTLTFSVSNRPGWLNFNSSTGRLSGTPGANDVGTYNNIVVSVSDGTVSKSLPAFSITVTALSGQSPGTGTISLSWNAPVARSDGQSLPVNEIARYTVYYGTRSGNYSNSVTVSDPQATSTSITDVPLGNYYVVMTTTDTGGREGGYSGEVVKPAQ